MAAQSASGAISSDARRLVILVGTLPGTLPSGLAQRAASPAVLGAPVAAASKHYPDTWLVTDSQGARVLVDRLELPFRHVDLSLDRLNLTDH
jgi:Family of unknown function (DUF6734)